MTTETTEYVPDIELIDNHTFKIATTGFVDIPVDITSFPGNPYIKLVFRITKCVDGLSYFGPAGLLAVEN